MIKYLPVVRHMVDQDHHMVILGVNTIRAKHDRVVHLQHQQVAHHVVHRQTPLHLAVDLNIHLVQIHIRLHQNRLLIAPLLVIRMHQTNLASMTRKFEFLLSTSFHPNSNLTLNPISPQMQSISN